LRNLLIFSLVLLVAASLTAPAFAGNQPGDTGPPAGIITTSPGFGGIRPVSPRELSDRVGGVIDELYRYAAPVVGKIGAMMAAVSAVMLLFAVFAGIKLLLRVFGALLAIGCGLILFDHAGAFVGVIESISHSLGGH